VLDGLTAGLDGELLTSPGSVAGQVDGCVAYAEPVQAFLHGAPHAARAADAVHEQDGRGLHGPSLRIAARHAVTLARRRSTLPETTTGPAPGGRPGPGPSVPLCDRSGRGAALLIARRVLLRGLLGVLGGLGLGRRGRGLAAGLGLLGSLRGGRRLGRLCRLSRLRALGALRGLLGGSSRSVLLDRTLGGSLGLLHGGLLRADPLGDQLDDGHRGVVTLARADLGDPGVAAVAL